MFLVKSEFMPGSFYLVADVGVHVWVATNHVEADKGEEFGMWINKHWPESVKKTIHLMDCSDGDIYSSLELDQSVIPDIFEAIDTWRNRN